MRAIRGTLQGVKGLALTAAIVVPVSVATTSLGADHATPQRSITAQLARSAVVPGAETVVRTAAPTHCHGAGALVITPRGRLKEVSLARGLRTYAHKAPGYFVALCPTTSQGS